METILLSPSVTILIFDLSELVKLSISSVSFAFMDLSDEFCTFFLEKIFFTRSKTEADF